MNDMSEAPASARADKSGPAVETWQEMLLPEERAAGVVRVTALLVHGRSVLFVLLEDGAGRQATGSHCAHARAANFDLGRALPGARQRALRVLERLRENAHDKRSRLRRQELEANGGPVRFGSEDGRGGDRA
jgi:hypothetical protein